MRSIEFKKDSYYLRKGVQKMEVDENTLQPIGHGLAIAKAKVYCYTVESSFSSYKKPKPSIYYCEGIIDENFKEAFLAKSEEDPAKYLMFREENKRILSFGNNDMIVEQLHKEQGRLEKRYTHLKLIYNKPYIVKEGMRDFSFTSMEDTVILENQLYIVSASKPFGPKFSFLKEDEEKQEEFLVVDKIKLPIDEEHSFPIVDILTYRMNKNFEVISYVYSLLEGGTPIYTNSTNVEEIHNERIEMLQNKKNSLEHILAQEVTEVSNTSYTSIPNVIIEDNQFYYQSIFKPFGPKFFFLKEEEEKPGKFLVVDKIKVPKDVNSKFSYSITDFLVFKMNKDFGVLSTPYSLLDEGPVYFSSTHYKEIREEREKFLMEKRTLLKENIESLENTYKLHK